MPFRFLKTGLYISVAFKQRTPCKYFPQHMPLCSHKPPNIVFSTTLYTISQWYRRRALRKIFLAEIVHSLASLMLVQYISRLNFLQLKLLWEKIMTNGQKRPKMAENCSCFQGGTVITWKLMGHRMKWYLITCLKVNLFYK